jgi:biotin transport system substrate-specific component
MLTANPTQTQIVTPARLALAEISKSLPGKMAIAVSASAFVALCAHASIHLPFTPVPITLSDLAVLLVGLALGPSAAFAALVLYLAEGVCGLPVFNAGPGGVAQLLGPTGGYLLAYPLAAALAGLISRKARILPALAGSLGATLVIMTCGVAWLTLYLHFSFSTAFWLGAVPFLPGQVLKVLAAAGIYTSLKRLRQA